jgi:hypothetical protein
MGFLLKGQGAKVRFKFDAEAAGLPKFLTLDNVNSRIVKFIGQPESCKDRTAWIIQEYKI